MPHYKNYGLAHATASHMLSKPLTQRPRLEVLTTLRFFAAMLVVFTHWNPDTFQGAPRWFQAFILNGYWAVSFFFVLSGFVLTYTYGDPRNTSGLRASAGQFWAARIARIWPVYLLALVLALPAFIYSAFVSHIVTRPGFFGGLVCVPLLIQAWFPLLAMAWNIPAWSLSVEALFYALFPLLTRKLNTWEPRKLIACALVLVCGLSLFRHLVHPLPESGGARMENAAVHHFFTYFPLFHIPTFLFGVALGKLYLSESVERWRYQNLCLVVGLGTVSLLFSMHGTLNPVFLTDAFLVPLFGVVVLSAATCSGGLNRLLSHPWLVELGEASYAIYILHLPLAIWAYKFWRSFTGAQVTSHLFLLFLYLVLLVGFCLLTFECFEKPLRRRLFERLNARLNTAIVL